MGAVPHSEDVPLWTDLTMVKEIDGLFTLSSSVPITHAPKNILPELKNFLIQLLHYPSFLISYSQPVQREKINKLILEFFLTPVVQLRQRGMTKISVVNSPTGVLEPLRWPMAWQISRVLAWYTGQPWMQMVTWH